MTTGTRVTASPGLRPPARRYATRTPADVRRQQVLDAALRIIARDGYRAVSIDAVARELGVTRPVVYNQFEGLDDLLHALLDRQGQRALGQLLDAIGAEPDLRDFRSYVHGTILRLLVMVAADPVAWAPIFAPAAATPETVRRRIDRDREAIRDRLEQVVAGAVAAGALPSETDAGIASHALVGVGEHFGRLAVEQPRALDPERVATALTALFLPPGAPHAD